ncbi:hypothetical protein ENBRE01_2914 [Enteropsectra breve]|nr:hypothetical protein ENBRE01_2914 [Enteropsectra breve]
MLDYVSPQQLATTIGNVPQFSGEPAEDVVHWINIFKLAVTSKSLNSDGARLLLLCLLTGEAKNFYSLIEGDHKSIEEILNALQQRFEKPSRATLLSKLKAMSKLPNESTAAFVERYIVLARRCNIPEELQLDWITDHIPQQLITILATFKVAEVQLSVEKILDILHSDVMTKIDSQNSYHINAMSQVKHKRKEKSKWCEYHKRCKHTTDKCRALNKDKSVIG